ncbi:hypothetical protein K438DRAFT_1939902 [Mycena galopus ATCC 62051]|nr:hypothetical protein K438DRAFT_1939902 [Mycena galopus ATCC 62051]
MHATQFLVKLATSSINLKRSLIPKDCASLKSPPAKSSTDITLTGVRGDAVLRGAEQQGRAVANCAEWCLTACDSKEKICVEICAGMCPMSQALTASWIRGPEYLHGDRLGARLRIGPSQSLQKPASIPSHGVQAHVRLAASGINVRCLLIQIKVIAKLFDVPDIDNRQLSSIPEICVASCAVL